MSLINDALKKAQKQRTGEASVPPAPTAPGHAPAPASQPDTHYARHSTTKSDNLNTLLVRLGIGGTILAVIIVGAIVLLRQKPPATITVNHVAAAAEPAPVKGEPIKPAPTPPPAASSFVVPAASTPSPAPIVAETPAPKLELPKPVAPVVVEPVTAQVEPARTPTAPGKLAPAAIQYIENLRIAGIRASATDSKVLMNDRVYRLGDTVEYQMGLRLVEIDNGRLTFENDQGIRYTRLFH